MDVGHLPDAQPTLASLYSPSCQPSLAVVCGGDLPAGGCPCPCLFGSHLRWCTTRQPHLGLCSRPRFVHTLVCAHFHPGLRLRSPSSRPSFTLSFALTSAVICALVGLHLGLRSSSPGPRLYPRSRPRSPLARRCLMRAGLQGLLALYICIMYIVSMCSLFLAYIPLTQTSILHKQCALLA